MAIDVMHYASVQYSILYQEFLDSSKTFYPSTGDPLKQVWRATGPTNGWTVGFFAGVYWNLFEYNITQEALARALDVTEPLTALDNTTAVVDRGFIIMSCFGNGYRLLKRSEYFDAIVSNAHRDAHAYSSAVRCSQPGTHTGYFTIFIDNIMNLELLFEAANLTNNQTLYNLAWHYANITLYESFRENNSTYHVVEYNQSDCSAIRKYTIQGYADWSTWSRGQSWGVYGYTIVYRYTKEKQFLDKAIGAANYVLTHLPSSTDMIPYWDYDAPYNSTIPYQPRDTSAAAIFASALVELSQYVPTTELKDRFLTSARTIIDQLTSTKYSIYGNKEYKLPAILANGTVGPYPRSLYDASLSYGDYYLTQAVTRLVKL